MADGIEDLQEKNKDAPKLKNEKRYDSWRVFQGREDAEMLLEKSSRSNYDSWGDDDDF